MATRRNATYGLGSAQFLFPWNSLRSIVNASSIVLCETLATHDTVLNKRVFFRSTSIYLVGRVVKSKGSRRDVDGAVWRVWGRQRETRLTEAEVEARWSGSNSFCFTIQFSWALVHEIFNKKVDISSGAFCSPFVPSLFLRKRLHRKGTCRVLYSVRPTPIFYFRHHTSRPYAPSLV